MEKECLSSKRSQELYKLLLSLKPKGYVKVGFNETIKAINNNLALIAVIAKDAVPPCLVDPLPVLCEQKGVPFVFIDSKTALGKACGLEIDVLSCAIFVPKHEEPTKIANELSKILK
jgi:ribosomal protein L7Ae-like RNA K-turn-binding protein